MRSLQVKMTRSNRNIKWRFLSSLIHDDDTLKLILSDKILSPWEYLRLPSPRIDSVDGLVLLLAIRKANMTGYSSTSEACNSFCNYCAKMTTEIALYSKMLFFPFGIISEENLFSLVTCSGKTDQGYKLGIIFAPFHLRIWISILFCVFLLLATWVLNSRYCNFKSVVDTGISLVLGTFGYDILPMSSKNSRLVGFFFLWSFIGILIGNLYQARLTESLVAPQKFSPIETLQELLDNNFTILLISSRIYPESLPRDSSLQQRQKYWLGRCHSGAKFCTQIIGSETIRSILSLRTEVITTACLENILGCEKMFAGKSYLKRLPELISIVRNYTVLMSQLSACSKNVVFIHNRREMHKIVKPKLPHVVFSYRRKFKYQLLPDDTVPNQPFTCKTEGMHLIRPIVKRYVEHGLHSSWANLALGSMFHWNTGVRKDVFEEYKTYTSKFDEKFVSILLTTLAAYAISIVSITIESVFSYGRPNWLAFGRFRRYFYNFFLRIEQTMQNCRMHKNF